MSTIEILGTIYKVLLDDTNISAECDGDVSVYDKEIRIRPLFDMLDKSAGDEALEARYDEVVLHELIHAYLFESGLEEMSEDEDLVNWMAIQIPKIMKSHELIVGWMK